MGTSAGLAALLSWVWAANEVRWLLFPPVSMAQWIALDALMVSWYVAHVLAVDRGPVALHVAGVTALGTVGHAVAYAGHLRPLGLAQGRLTWLAGSGLIWSAWGFLAWSSGATGVDRAIGMLSAGLSVIQVLNLDSLLGYKVGPLAGYSVATILLIFDFAPHLTRSSA